ncbi:MAG: hypothetical protein OEM05_09805 [Myxococcales bacterium]|nr:hypothetical protein [Myxococcales bacterium]
MARINLFGGTAVLASYAYCLVAYSAQTGDFWGGVPDRLRSVYTVNMCLAAAGYFAFTYFLMYRLKPTTSGGSCFGFGTFNALYALILLPSALWMPLTFAMLESPSDGLWWAIRLTLAAVGIGSLGLLAGLVAVRPSPPSLAHKLAVVGSLAFCFQTAFLDALVWPAFFPA